MSTYASIEESVVEENGYKLEENFDHRKNCNESLTTIELKKTKKTEVADVAEDDIPLPDGFIFSITFWKSIAVGTSTSIIMAFVALGFLNCIDEVPKQWITCDFSIDRHCGEWYKGEKYWIAVCGSTGAIVGFIRYISQYPSNLPGLLKEISDGHVNPVWIPWTFIISMISISGGATLGPEVALSNFGGGISTFITENWVVFDNEDDRKLVVLAGISSALGAVFPSPMLGLALIHELNNFPKSYMESLMVLAFSAYISFLIFYGFTHFTYLDHISSSVAQLSKSWTAHGGYKPWMFSTGILIGLVSSCLSFATALMIGIMKKVFDRIRLSLAWNKLLQCMVPPIIGGITIGAVNWALPATVGNGNLVFSYFIRFGALHHPLLDRNLLLCTGFAKMFLLAVSMHCGFIGGAIYPFLTIGVIAGVIMHQIYPYIHLGLCVTTFLVSIAAGIVPIPITLTMLSSFIFYLGAYETVPIFIACMTSYFFVGGSGIFKQALRFVSNKIHHDVPDKKEAKPVENIPASEIIKSEIVAHSESPFVIDKTLMVNGGHNLMELRDV